MYLLNFTLNYSKYNSTSTKMPLLYWFSGFCFMRLLTPEMICYPQIIPGFAHAEMSLACLSPHLRCPPRATHSCCAPITLSPESQCGVFSHQSELTFSCCLQDFILAFDLVFGPAMSAAWVLTSVQFGVNCQKTRKCFFTFLSSLWPFHGCSCWGALILFFMLSLCTVQESSSHFQVR